LRKLLEGFEILLPSGKVLLVDPTLSDPTMTKRDDVVGADYIAVADNASVRDAGRLAQKFNSKVICSHDVADPLAKFFNLDFANIIRATAGQTIVFDDLKVEVKKAEHIAMLQPIRNQYQQETGEGAPSAMSLIDLLKALPSYQKKAPAAPEFVEYTRKLNAAGLGLHFGENLNFVFQTNDNLRIYIFWAGAYDFLRQEIIQAHPHVFVAELGRGNDPERLAEFAALSGAEIVIPFNYENYGENKAPKMVEAMAKHLAVKPKVQFVDMVRGRYYEIGVKVSAI